MHFAPTAGVVCKAWTSRSGTSIGGVPAASRSCARDSSRTISWARPPASSASSSGRVAPGAKPVSTRKSSVWRCSQQPAGHVVDAELAATGQVVLRGRKRLEVEDRGTPPPYGEADHRVEEGRAQRARPGGLVEHRLELTPVHVAKHDAVTVVVDETELVALVGGGVTQADSRS